MNMNFKENIKNKLGLIQFIFTVSILIILFKNINLKEVNDVFLKTDITYLLFAFLSLVTAIFLAFIRWFVICNSLGITLSRYLSFLVSAKSNFFSQVLPTGFGGDVYKLVFSKMSNIKTSSMLMTIFIDRLSGFIFLFLFFIFGLISFYNLDNIYFILVSITMIAILFLFKLFFKLEGILLISIMSFMSQSLTVIFFIFMFYALDLNISILDIMFLCNAALMLSMIPVSFSGWGIREASLSYLMGNYFNLFLEGIAISVTYGLVLIVISVNLYSITFLLFKYFDAQR